MMITDTKNMASESVKLIEEDVEGGGKEQDMNEINYINIRLGFLRKVYGLLSLQLLITVMVSTVFMAFQPLKTFLQENPWTIMLSFIMTMGTLIALYIKRREHPANLMLLTLFTLSKAYTVAILVSMYEVTTVLQALFLTLTVVVGLTIYAFQGKRQPSISISGLFIGLWILLLGGFMQIFLQNSLLELTLGITGAILMSMFIIFDTRLMMHTLSPEEYILATINIYLDIINLFMYVLRILSETSQ
ncbi:protein lifeguard 4-like [Colletes gigas]|uniref:protein lifeguard 4-like n=1 Tax=Colletes gigas TaxID=935657 RepID=UPI001C9AD946|nr:protein lifeguard 4-like [Colletes gigas]